MELTINEDLFGPIWKYIQDENVTDIKWNGSTLWIDDLTKGRYMAYTDEEYMDEKGNVIRGHNPLKLNEEWVKIFTSKVANSVNENFNITEPSLKAETDELRIQAEHYSVSGDSTIAFAIRKTPSVSRLAGKKLSDTGYATPLVEKLLPCLMRAHCSGIITGDVGSGKTELEKYLVKFIPDEDGIITVEDTLEMKIKKLYPWKDVYSMKVSEQFETDAAIKDALRLLTKWLIISESRGKDIARVMEGASTGCCALTSIHAENVWQIPDRIMSMIGDDAQVGFENDVFTFFNYAIKVKVDKSQGKITRHIDQIAFFDRDSEGKKNSITVFVENGKWTGKPIPNRIYQRFIVNNEVEFLEYYQEQIRLYNEEVRRLQAQRQTQERR